MKKILFSVIIALLAIGAASAQKLVSFGPKVGINVSSMSGIKDVANGMKPNFMGGLYFELRPLNFLGISVEALYSGQGIKTGDIQFKDFTANIDANIGYIAVPIMAKLYLGKRLSINAGYQPSFALNSTIDLGGNGNAAIKAKKVISAIPVGLSYSFLWGLLIDARYNIALSNATEGYTLASGEMLRMKNQSFSFSLGWKF